VDRRGRRGPNRWSGRAADPRRRCRAGRGRRPLACGLDAKYRAVAHLLHRPALRPPRRDGRRVLSARLPRHGRAPRGRQRRGGLPRRLLQRRARRPAAPHRPVRLYQGVHAERARGGTHRTGLARLRAAALLRPGAGALPVRRLVPVHPRARPDLSRRPRTHRRPRLRTVGWSGRAARRRAVLHAPHGVCDGRPARPRRRAHRDASCPRLATRGRVWRDSRRRVGRDGLAGARGRAPHYGRRRASRDTGAARFRGAAACDGGHGVERLHVRHLRAQRQLPAVRAGPRRPRVVSRPAPPARARRGATRARRRVPRREQPQPAASALRALVPVGVG